MTSNNGRAKIYAGESKVLIASWRTKGFAAEAQRDGQGGWTVAVHPIRHAHRKGNRSKYPRRNKQKD